MTIKAKNNETAIITGSAIRIGREITLDLVKKNWNIALHCNSSYQKAELLAKEITKNGGVCEIFQADLIQKHQTENLMKSVTKIFPRISLLINNASVIKKDNIYNITEKTKEDNMAVNLYAPLMLIKNFVKHVNNANIDKANIINICDSSCGLSINGDYLSYSLSKLGLMNLTRLLAPKIAPKIRINSISPGPTLANIGEDEIYKKIPEKIPMGKLNRIEDILSAMDFILKTESLTGQNIEINGGMEGASW